MKAPPILTADSPPLLAPDRKSGSLPQFFAILLSLCLGLFLADAVISLADASLTCFWGLHLLSSMSGLVSCFSVLMAVGMYVLIGLTPMVPKRNFLPIPLFYLLATLALCPFAIYWYGRIQQVAWGVSICQLILGLLIFGGSQGGLKFHWPLVSVGQLGLRWFSWLNLFAFLLVNILVLLPTIADMMKSPRTKFDGGDSDAPRNEAHPSVSPCTTRPAPSSTPLPTVNDDRCQRFCSGASDSVAVSSFHGSARKPVAATAAIRLSRVIVVSSCSTIIKPRSKSNDNSRTPARDCNASRSGVASSAQSSPWTRSVVVVIHSLPGSLVDVKQSFLVWPCPLFTRRVAPAWRFRHMRSAASQPSR